MGEQRFKVGDWVRVKDNRGAPLDYKVGDVCQVSAVRDDLVFSNKKPGMFAKRFEPWQPRVGERVRVVRAELSHKADRIGLEFNVPTKPTRYATGCRLGAETTREAMSGALTNLSQSSPPPQNSPPLSRSRPASSTRRATEGKPGLPSSLETSLRSATQATMLALFGQMTVDRRAVRTN